MLTSSGALTAEIPKSTKYGALVLAALLAKYTRQRK